VASGRPCCRTKPILLATGRREGSLRLKETFDHLHVEKQPSPWSICHADWTEIRCVFVDPTSGSTEAPREFRWREKARCLLIVHRSSCTTVDNQESGNSASYRIDALRSQVHCVSRCNTTGSRHVQMPPRSRGASGERAALPPVSPCETVLSVDDGTGWLPAFAP
jgi:hypothetical protein